MPIHSPNASLLSKVGYFGGLSGHQGALRSAVLIRSGLSKEAFILGSIFRESVGQEGYYAYNTDYCINNGFGDCYRVGSRNYIKLSARLYLRNILLFVRKSYKDVDLLHNLRLRMYPNRAQ